MQFLATFSTFSLLILSALAQTNTDGAPTLKRVARFSANLGDRNTLLTETACSAFGKQFNFRTLGDIADIVNVSDDVFLGATDFVAGVGSLCGSCWEVVKTEGAQTAIRVFTVDHVRNGFNVELDGLNALTGGRGKELGKANVEVTQVPPSACGFA